MFEKYLRSKKKEDLEKPSGPSFEELVKVLPENEQAELKRLQNIEESLITVEDEKGEESEIHLDQLSQSELNALRRYGDLLKKARDLYKEKGNL